MKVLISDLQVPNLVEPGWMFLISISMSIEPWREMIKPRMDKVVCKAYRLGSDETNNPELQQTIDVQIQVQCGCTTVITQ